MPVSPEAKARLAKKKADPRYADFRKWRDSTRKTRDDGTTQISATTFDQWLAGQRESAKKGGKTIKKL